MSGLIHNKWVNPAAALGRDVADPLRLFPKEPPQQPPRKPAPQKPTFLVDDSQRVGL